MKLLYEDVEFEFLIALREFDIIKDAFLSRVHSDIIMSDPQVAYAYAYYVLNGPFPEGEHVIAQDARSSYSYSMDILDGRFPLGEPAIAKDPYYSLAYASSIIKGRFPEGEKAIYDDRQYICVYEYMFHKKY